MSSRAPDRTPEGFIPNNHCWYERTRLVTTICQTLNMTPQRVGQQLPYGGGPYRRWTGAVNATDGTHLRLPAVDRLCCALGLNLTAVLGEPDLVSSMPPAWIHNHPNGGG